MSRPPIQSSWVTECVNVAECYPDSERPFVHWFVYDRRDRCNIVMGAKTKEDALCQAVEYWAKKWVGLNDKHQTLEAQVQAFVDSVRPEWRQLDDD